MTAERRHRAPRSYAPIRWNLRASIAVLVAFATVLAVGGVAFAYLTATGTGTGTATTGTLNPPTAVSGSQVTHTSNVAVSWTAPVGGVAPTGYYVLRTPSPSGTTVAACGTSALTPTVNTSCSDNSVPNGDYAYVVVAVHHTWTATSAPSAVVTVVETTQTITFTSSPVSPTVGGTYDVTATGGGSGNPVTFSSATPGTCTVVGSTVTLAHAGSCTVNANQAGNAQYNAAPQVQQTFTIAKAAQIISYTTSAPSGAVVGGSGYTPAANGGASGNSVTFTIDASTAGNCSISGGLVTYQHVGSCTVNADQTGDADYLAANTVQQSYAIGQGSQAINFTSTAPANAKVGGATYNVTATGGASGNAVTFSSGSPAICTVAGSTVSFIAAGTCVVNADQAGSTDYLAAGQVQQSFAVTKQDQTITFSSTAPSNAKNQGATYNVTATASSGQTVTLTIDAASSTVCSLSGSTVSFIGAGTCVINANQAGNGTYNAAPQVQQSFAVAKGDQTITFTSTAPSNAKNQGATYNVTATASSGLTVALTVDASASTVCSLSGSTVTFIGAGTCVINANQAGNGNFNAAPQAQQSFAVAKGDQTITFTSSAPSATVGGTTYTPTATANPSGLTVAFAIAGASSSVCSISAGVVSFQAVGTCTINANQAGNANYNAAGQVQQNVTVGKGAQTITFTSPAPSATVGGASYTPTATASPSGLPVAFTIAGASSSICSISGGVVTFQAVGTCTINANQGGNANYNAAPQATQAVTVGKGSQTIAFTSTAPTGTNAEVGDTYTPTATATSGLAVTFGVSGGCTISSGVVTFTAAGTCTITASQTGNANWNAATPVAQNVTVIAANPKPVITGCSRISGNNKGYVITWTWAGSGSPNGGFRLSYTNLSSGSIAASAGITSPFTTPNINGTLSGTFSLVAIVDGVPSVAATADFAHTGNNADTCTNIN